MGCKHSLLIRSQVVDDFGEEPLVPASLPPLWVYESPEQTEDWYKFKIPQNFHEANSKTLPITLDNDTFVKVESARSELVLRDCEQNVLAVCKRIGKKFTRKSFRIFKTDPIFPGQRPYKKYKGATMYHYASISDDGQVHLVHELKGEPTFNIRKYGAFKRAIFARNETELVSWKRKNGLNHVQTCVKDIGMVICLVAITDLLIVDAQSRNFIRF